ncbi:MAG: hypothetical protein OXT67_09930 [Zetaproteobacteria bacterium]|nr:hypothetical protein [Zetaproteobacteria bacterium]
MVSVKGLLWCICLALGVACKQQDATPVANPSAQDSTSGQDGLESRCTARGSQYAALGEDCIHLPTTALSENVCARLADAVWEADLQVCYHPALAEQQCGADAPVVPFACASSSPVAQTFLQQCAAAQEKPSNLHQTLWLNLVNQPLAALSCEALLEHLWRRKEISLVGARLQDTTWVQVAVNLRSLDLWGNEVSDLTPIFALSQLVILKVGGNRITSLVGIAALSKLTRFSVQSNQIKDFAPLHALEQLQFLDISYNPGTLTTAFDPSKFPAGLYQEPLVPRALEIDAPASIPKVLPPEEKSVVTP